MMNTMWRDVSFHKNVKMKHKAKQKDQNLTKKIHLKQM